MLLSAERQRWTGSWREEQRCADNKIELPARVLSEQHSLQRTHFGNALHEEADMDTPNTLESVQSNSTMLP
jgi:hypothetical protein